MDRRWKDTYATIATYGRLRPTKHDEAKTFSGSDFCLFCSPIHITGAVGMCAKRPSLPVCGGEKGRLDIHRRLASALAS
jgi:hypothetical protein